MKYQTHRIRILIKSVLLTAVLAGLLETTTEARSMTEQTNSGFPPTLITATPEDGFELAIKLARLAVKATQPDTEVLKNLRSEYANHAFSLIAVSEVVAVHFQTIAAANNYWRT
jgi:hypothetical protein